MNNTVNQRVIKTINTLISERLAGSKKEVAEILEVSASTISEVLAERQGATSKILEGLVKNFRINGNWLLSGEGSMFAKEPNQNNTVNDPAPVYGKGDNKTLNGMHAAPAHDLDKMFKLLTYLDKTVERINDRVVLTAKASEAHEKSISTIENRLDAIEKRLARS